MKKALIVSAGEVKGTLLNDKYELVIAADGGFDKAKELSLKVDLFVGDMDSVKNTVDIPKVKLQVEKDFTDTEAAICEAVKRGYKEIHLIGALGTRFDHSLANALLIKKYLKIGINLKLIDSHNEIFGISGETFLEGKKGDTVSLIPLDECLKGLTLEGFYYPCDGRDVKMGETLTVSNVVTSDKAKITINEGIALIIIAKD